MQNTKKPFSFNPNVTAFTFTQQLQQNTNQTVNITQPTAIVIPAQCRGRVDPDNGGRSQSALDRPCPQKAETGLESSDNPKLTKLSQLQDIYSINPYVKPYILRLFKKEGLTRIHFDVWIGDENTKRKAKKLELGVVSPRFIGDPPEISMELNTIDGRRAEYTDILDIETIRCQITMLVEKYTQLQYVPSTQNNIPLELYSNSLGVTAYWVRTLTTSTGIQPTLNSQPPSILNSNAVPVGREFRGMEVHGQRKNLELIESGSNEKDIIFKPLKSPLVMQQAHIFIDYSNLLAGLRSSRSCTQAENRRKHINVTALCDIIHKSIETSRYGKRIVVGANIAELTCVDWKKNGYDVKQMITPVGVKEKFIDEALHSCIASVLLAEDAVSNPQILVIGTGDGNKTEGTNSFPNLAEAAARHGWNVIIWSWSFALSRKFREVYDLYPERIIINMLDEHYDNISMTNH